MSLRLNRMGLVIFKRDPLQKNISFYLESILKARLTFKHVLRGLYLILRLTPAQLLTNPRDPNVRRENFWDLSAQSMTARSKLTIYSNK